MTTQTRAPAATAATEADGGTPVPLPPTPTLTRYQQIADEFLRQFETLITIIPRLETPHASTVEFVRTHANVAVEFLATVTASVEQHAPLQVINKLDAVDARDKLQYMEAFRTVVDRVMAFLDSLRFTLNSEKAFLTADCLQVYAIGQALARDPGSADIAQAVANMKRDLGRRGRPKKIDKPEQPPATPATPATPASPPTPPAPQKGAAG